MSNIPCILIPALVGIISGILGYLLGKMSSKGGDDSALLALQADLDACRSNSKNLTGKIANLEGDLASAKSNVAQSFTSAAPVFLFDVDAYKAVFGKKIKQDDLKIVEGIGPKIEELYHAAGVKTWQDLSQTSVQKSQSILDAAGERYVIHNPSTWAKQAELAYHGKWQELKDWQDALDGGKE